MNSHTTGTGKPTIILSPEWRFMAELFSAAALRDLHARFDIVWGQDGTIPDDLYSKALPHACAIIAAQPRLSMDDLASAPNLKVVIEVSGSFPDSIEVLSCSPGFRESVAEMGLAMLLAGARGLVDEHEAFRQGSERWLQDRPETDFPCTARLLALLVLGRFPRK